MNKIIFNPDTGAPISDVTFEKTRYFSEKFWEPGSPYKFEDDKTAQFFLDTFQFLEEISIDKAKDMLNKPEIKCAKCEFATRNQKTLTTHEKKHVAEAQLDELGIPVVRQTNQQKIASEIIKDDLQQEIEKSEDNFRDGYSGLDQGEGLTHERV
jgi:hypothetical protein